jgi:hypothetical protein
MPVEDGYELIRKIRRRWRISPGGAGMTERARRDVA